MYCLPGRGVPHRPDAVAVTGSEDGTLRRMTIDLQQPLQPLHNSQLIGEHPAGSAVKALSFTPWGPGECLESLSGLLHLTKGATQVIACTTITFLCHVHCGALHWHVAVLSNIDDWLPLNNCFERARAILCQQKQ